ncbi:cytochrome P450 [Russula vinacea]|nr:cytochrome P450 [Russula vinacea]
MTAPALTAPGPTIKLQVPQSDRIHYLCVSFLWQRSSRHLVTGIFISPSARAFLNGLGSRSRPSIARLLVEPNSRQQVLATVDRGTVIYTPPARVPLSRRLIAVAARSVYIPSFPSTENTPIMSLTTLTQYWPVGHTLKSTSKLDAGVLVLATSLPRSQLSHVTLLIVIPALLSAPISYSVRSSSCIAFPLAFAAYWSCLVFVTLTYRLSPFHPLAKYPGPVLAKSSKWWGAYYSATGDQHRCLKRLHDQHGDIVRIGPNELSICDASLIHPVLGQGGLRKGPRWDGRPGTPSLIAQRDPVKHLQQRKPWNLAFSAAALKEYEVIVAKRTRQFIGCLENLVHGSDHRESVVLDMGKWLNYFTTDFMGDMAFGGGFELMEAGGDEDGIWTILESGLHVSSIVSHVPYITALLSATNGKLRRAIAFGRGSVSKRLGVGANRKDLFYYLSGEELPEAERPSFEDIAQNGTLAIIAGSDTTSSVLSAVIYYLLLNPAAYERLQEEVDSAFPSGEEPLDTVKLSHLEWLNGCINELFVYSPLFQVARSARWTVPKYLGSWSYLSGRSSPFTRTAYIGTRVTSTRPRYSSGAVAQQGRACRRTQYGCILPFSYGPTICAGKNLALMEMRMVLCWIMRHFHLSKAPGVAYEEWEERSRIGLWCTMNLVGQRFA